MNQFSRTELLIGKEGIEKLANSRVAIFGIGGVGGYTVEALARSGVGEFDLIDDDRVCLTNINRQILATRSTVGKYKVDVAMERILDINPRAQVHVYKTFYMPDTADQFDFSVYDYVVDAIDTVTGKLQLVEQAYRTGTRKQDGCERLSGGGYLEDKCLPAGKGHAPGAQKARHQKAEGRLLNGAADRTEGDGRIKLQKPLCLPAGNRTEMHGSPSDTGQYRVCTVCRRTDYRG